MSSAFLPHLYWSHSDSYAAVLRSFPAQVAYSGHREAGLSPHPVWWSRRSGALRLRPVCSLTATGLTYSKCLYTRCGAIEKHYVFLYIQPVLFMKKLIKIYCGNSAHVCVCVCMHTINIHDNV